MKARFIEGASDRLGVAFEAETPDETLLLRIWNQQIAPYNLLRVSGWTHRDAKVGYGLSTMRAHVVVPAEGFAPHLKSDDRETLERTAMVYAKANACGHDRQHDVALAYTAGYLGAMKARDLIEGRVEVSKESR